MSDWGLEERTIALQAEVTALRKTLSVVLYLMASNALTSRNDLAQIVGIISEDLLNKSAAEPEGSVSGDSLRRATEVLTEIVDAAVRPLPDGEEIAPQWPGRSQIAALESLIAALIVVFLQGQTDQERAFAVLRQVTRATADLREWQGKDSPEAEQMRRETKEEADRMLLGVARALSIELTPESEALEEDEEEPLEEQDTAVAGPKPGAAKRRARRRAAKAERRAARAEARQNQPQEQQDPAEELSDDAPYQEPKRDD